MCLFCFEFAVAKRDQLLLEYAREAKVTKRPRQCSPAGSEPLLPCLTAVTASLVGHQDNWPAGRLRPRAEGFHVGTDGGKKGARERVGGTLAVP